jgi:acetyl-CoA C-acetyltransferase
VRTPIGDFGGGLKSVSHEQLAVTVLKEVCERVDFSKELVDDVYWGTVMVRSDENGLARGSVLKAGFGIRYGAAPAHRRR